MSATWKTVRVFISSTFRDMQAERDHLVRFVFPKLRQELLQQRIHLVDVDLRWGVTSDQDASEVCREVVDECHPRFLCMLGGRYGWVPKDRPRSITADEIHYGVLDREATQRGFSNFYFRDDRATAAMVETTEGEFREPSGSDSQKALAKLKQDIADAGLNPFTYPAQWDKQSRRLIGLAKFGNQVHDDLLRSMKDDPELRDRFTETTERLDEFAEENAAMEAFISERTERFVLGSRKTVIDELLAHAHGTGGNGYLCLVGEPGSGKSALLAHFSQVIQQQALSHETPFLLIPHFVGASPGSTDVRRTLRRMCHELVKGTGLTAEIPEDPEKLRVAFVEILQQASAKKRVLILLDAINQFDSSTQLAGWSWLPEELPATARVILSTLSGPALDSLRQRRQPPRPLELNPLENQDQEAIITGFLNRYRKSMSVDQRAALLDKADAGTPLYLLVSLEELRTLGTYEEITDRIAQLPPDTRALFIWILKRLEDDDGFRDASGQKIGRELVTRFISLLGASRHGLSQQELVELLSPGDPQGNVAALTQLLRPYLMQRGELLDFYHGQFREAAATSYLPSKSQQLPAHDQLTTYFRDKADPEKNESWKGVSPRPFLELPFHLARTDADKLTKLLFDFNWLQAKTDKTLVQELILDYDEALDVLPEAHPQRCELELVQASLRLSAHVIIRDNCSLACQLIGRLSSAREVEIKELILAARAWRGSVWFLPVNPNFQSPGTGLIRTVVGIDGVVTALAISADGRRALSASQESQSYPRRTRTLQLWDLESGAEIFRIACTLGGISTMKLSSDGKCALLASDDGLVELWDMDGPTKLRALKGPCSNVYRLTVTPDWRRAISASWDSTIKVWDLNTGEELCSLIGHPGGTSEVAVTPNGNRVLSYSSKVRGRISVWDTDTGKVLRELTGFSGFVRALATNLDGTRVLAFLMDSSDRSEFEEDGSRPVKAWAYQTITTWHLETGKELGTLRCLGGVVDGDGVAFSPDGAWAISSSGHVENALRFWRLMDNHSVSTARGVTGEVDAVAISGISNRAVTASWDVLRVWDLTLPLASAPCGHNRGITALTISQDGLYAVSAAEDMVFKVWDLVNGVELRSMAGHKDNVHALSVNPDSRLLLSGSNDHTLKVWDLHSGRVLCSLIGHEGRVLNAAFLPDGKHAISSSPDGTIRLWDLEHGQSLFAATRPRDITSVAFTSDGKTAAFAVKNEAIQIWDLGTSQVKKRLMGHDDYIEGLAFSFDGSLLTSVSMDGLARVWDVETGLELQAFKTSNNGQCVMVKCVDYDHPMALFWGSHLVLWDTVTRQVIASFTGETDIWAAAVTPDGRTFIAGEASGRVHILHLVYPKDQVAT